MKHIDFLPEIYTQNRVQRRAQRWWCLAAAAFAAVVLLAASAQWMIRNGIERELAEIEPKYAEALSRHTKLQSIQQETQRAEEIASLYVYLSHPWPRSQLLAGVIRPLPASVRLSEITISHEALPGGLSITPASSPVAGAKETPSPARIDLMLLRSECDGRQPILSITGTATAMTELHAYVDQLGKSPLVAAAHLKRVETAAAGSAADEPRFHLHVVVKPGYGQEGGPEIALTQSAECGMRSAGFQTADRNSALRIPHSALDGASP